MNVQDLLITDKQIAVDLFYNNGYHFSYEDKDYNFATREKVHEFFHKNTPYDTVKFLQEGQKSYIHFFHDEVEVYNTKKHLRRTLSQDSGGAWTEEQEGKRRYFIEEKGWLTITYRQVSKDECFQKLEAPSTLQKALGPSLSILALAPGVCEFARQLPFGGKEAALGLIALNHKSPAIGLLSASFNLMEVEAQVVGAEFRVNTNTTGAQARPSVTALSGGGFVVTWESVGQDGDLGGIYGQRYASDGTSIGGEFQVNTYTTDRQTRPRVAALSGGGFVVVWNSLGQDGDDYGVYGQRYDSSGVRNGSEFQVNTYTEARQASPSVAPLSDGGFVVTWESFGQENGNSLGVFGQRYTSSGIRSGTEFQINTYTRNDQSTPSAALLNDGGFVAIWASEDQDGNLWGIYGQRFDSSGAQSGTEFQVNTYTVHDQKEPSVGGLNDGGFVVTWSSFDQDGDVNGVYGQRYARSGARNGVEFLVNTNTASQQDFSSVSPLNDGGFVVAWESDGQDGDRWGIYAQRYDSNGMRMGSEFLVNTYTASYQRYPNVAALSDGGFVITWQSLGQDGDIWGIYGQRYASTGAAVGSPSFIMATSSTRQILATSTSQSTFRESTLLPPVTIRSILSQRSVASLSRRPSFIQDTEVSTSSLENTSTSALDTSSNPPIDNTSSFSAASSSSPLSPTVGATILSVDQIIYGQPYSIIQNGQIVGSYTFSGGVGQLASENPNVLNIQFNPNYSPQEGEIITLFTFSASQANGWGTIPMNGIGVECLEPRGEINSNSVEGGFYQIIFEDEGSCASLSPKILTSVMAMTTN